MYTNTDQEIRTLELRRLRELEKQAARDGPYTAPGVLIEIQDIYNKYPDAKRPKSRDNATLDLDFLLNTVAAALQRITLLEQRDDANIRARLVRQFVHDLWMIILTIICFATLIIVLAR